MPVINQVCIYLSTILFYKQKVTKTKKGRKPPGYVSCDFTRLVLGKYKSFGKESLLFKEKQDQ